MSKNIDISDLLVVDKRLKYNWREAEVKGEILHLQFPSTNYRIAQSRVENNTWYLRVEIMSSFGGATIKDEFLKIPSRVEKIVYEI